MDPSSQIPHNFRYTVEDPDPNVTGTALVARVQADRAGKTEIHWTTDARWTATRAIVLRNIRMHEVTSSQVNVASWSWESDTTCRRPPGDEEIRCPAVPVDRKGGYVTRGRIDDGDDLWYTAAFGADSASLSIEAHTENPIEVEWVQETETRLELIGPPGTVNGHLNLSVDKPSYGVITFTGPFNETPQVRIRGGDTEYEFRLDTGIWKNRSGEPVGVPGFPMANGSYTINATGGQGPRGNASEKPIVALARIISPKFVEPDGTFTRVKNPD